MGEKQFANWAEKAGKMQGNSAENLLKLLETRLDNVVYRAGFADSRTQARQMITHGFFKVNDKKSSIPSHSLEAKDKISPVNKDKFKEMKQANLPTWLNVDNKKIEAEILHLPSREEIDIPVSESLIIEFYSR